MGSKRKQIEWHDDTARFILAVFALVVIGMGILALSKPLWLSSGKKPLEPTLSTLLVWGADLTPEFDPKVTTYRAVLPGTKDMVMLTMIPTDDAANVTADFYHPPKIIPVNVLAAREAEFTESATKDRKMKRRAQRNKAAMAANAVKAAKAEQAAAAKPGTVVVGRKGRKLLEESVSLSPLRVGENKIIINVTTGLGNMEYTLLLYRASNPDDLKLVTLEVVDGHIHPQFDPDRFEYEVFVKHHVPTISFKTLPVTTKSSVSLQGHHFNQRESRKNPFSLYVSPPVEVLDHPTRVSLKVEGDDGISEKSYRFHLIHLPVAPPPEPPAPPFPRPPFPPPSPPGHSPAWTPPPFPSLLSVRDPLQAPSLSTQANPGSLHFLPFLQIHLPHPSLPLPPPCPPLLDPASLAPATNSLKPQGFPLMPPLFYPHP
ncbi:hypothetical protein CYMTET_26141 [Cymbomonas tetramitiformis]|uniref:Cadherin-like beta-sandwich-like domain-containing protein n=1 Tax=Cymbomonas tetramitiformis TaxID=36881 RepID=A0AAE0FSP6_9CHLO|nr:hypothetical protein CYMTET_26141 [Cymbomonas tetramitiformis]